MELHIIYYSKNDIPNSFDRLQAIPTNKLILDYLTNSKILFYINFFTIFYSYICHKLRTIPQLGI